MLGLAFIFTLFVSIDCANSTERFQALQEEIEVLKLEMEVQKQEIDAQKLEMEDQKQKINAQKQEIHYLQTTTLSILSKHTVNEQGTYSILMNNV